jgi:ankyrin repeat protein
MFLGQFDGYFEVFVIRTLSSRDTPLLSLRMLIDHGADVHARDQNGNTAAHIAAEADNDECADTCGL